MQLFGSTHLLSGKVDLNASQVSSAHSPCTDPHGYSRAFTILFPIFTSSTLPTTAKGRWVCKKSKIRKCKNSLQEASCLLRVCWEFFFVYKMLTKLWNCIIICTITPTTGLTPVRNQCWIKIRRNIISDSKTFSPSVIYDLMTSHWTYIHGGVNLGNSFVLCGELIDLHSITD